MVSHNFSQNFQIGSLYVDPVHIRIEQLRPVIPAHRHSHTSYEIHYTARGRGTTTVGGIQYPVHENTLYITGPDIEHSQLSEPTDPILEYCLYLHCRPVKNQEHLASSVDVFQKTKFWIGEDTENVFSVLKALIVEQELQSFGYEEMTESLLRQMIVLLTRTYQKQIPQTIGKPEKLSSASLSSNQYPLIEDAFFYQYQNLELHDLADMLHLSHRQTQRILKEHYGMTFSQKRSEARMAAACQMLRGTDFSIGDIAERVGFSSAEHLSTAFRRAFGKSPSAYRKEKRESDTTGNTFL